MQSQRKKYLLSNNVQAGLDYYHAASNKIRQSLGTA